MEDLHSVQLDSISIKASCCQSDLCSDYSNLCSSTHKSHTLPILHAPIVATFDDDLLAGIPLRQSKHSDLETIGALRAQEDWSQLIADMRGYRGSLGEKFNIVSVTAPECLPDRIEALAYMVEYAFLYDDYLENATISDGAAVTRARLGHKKMGELAIGKMAAIDPERTVYAVKAWTEWAAQVKEQPKDTSFRNFVDYFKCRVEDLGAGFWASTLIFGLALTLSHFEVEQCQRLTSHGFEAITLVNDLYSWDKERDEASLAGQEEVMNAVWVLMREHGIGENRAKALLLEKIMQCVRRFTVVVDNVNIDPDVSTEVKRFVNAVMSVHAGNVLWSRYCPRYHREEGWSELQREMIEKGVDAVLKARDLGSK